MCISSSGLQSKMLRGLVGGGRGATSYAFDMVGDKVDRDPAIHPNSPLRGARREGRGTPVALSREFECAK